MQCVVCTHSERDDIDAALLIHTPIEAVAQHYGLSVEDIKYHQKRCSPYTMTPDEFDSMVLEEVLSSSPSKAQEIKHPESLQRQINLREADYLTTVLQEYMVTLKATGREILHSMRMAQELKIPLKSILGQSVVDLYIGTGGEVRQTIKTLSDIGKQIRDSETLDASIANGAPQIMIVGRQ